MMEYSYQGPSVEGASASALPFRPQTESFSLQSRQQPKACLTLQVTQSSIQFQSTIGRRQQLSRDEWEALKPLIRRLYIEENKSFQYIAIVLRDNHNFLPTYDPIFHIS